MSLTSPSLSEMALGSQDDFEDVSTTVSDQEILQVDFDTENPGKPPEVAKVDGLWFKPGQASVAVPVACDLREAVKHGRFFFDDGNVIFLVEGTAYHLHRYFFARDSATFDSCFNEKGPVVVTLEDVQKDEMDAFLKVLYPIDFKTRDISTLKEWTAVLRLSNMWGFATLRALAVEQLERLASPVDKIILGRAYELRAWLEPAFIALGARANPLTIEEGRRLGVDDTVTVFHMRERQQLPSARPLTFLSPHRPIPTAPSPQKPQDTTFPSPLSPLSLASHPAPDDSTLPCFAVPPVISDLISSLDLDNFDATLDRVVEWANQQQDLSSEMAALAYRYLVALTFQKAVSEDKFLGVGAEFCERLAEHAHPSISDHLVLEKSGRAVQGKKLVRTYIQQRSIATIRHCTYDISTIHDQSSITRPSGAEIQTKYQHSTRFCQLVAGLFKAEVVSREIGLQAVGLLVDFAEAPGHESLVPLPELKLGRNASSYGQIKIPHERGQ
ncbi:hypothetical protein OF83DRAFT_1082203 [Amylostereum chailletii]|nr:hypothetical protein OF83DRAFT_1082203 [Amylostereum chailletii]